MHFNPYGGMAAELAAGLVNIAPATSTMIETLLREHDYRSYQRLDADQTAELMRWATRLRAVFVTTDLDRRIDMTNELVELSAGLPYISRHDGRAPHLHFAHEKDPLADRLKAYTSAGLAHAICDDHNRLGVCDRAGCDTVYVDTSRNGRRRFCTTRCANRVYVADHRARRTSP